MNLSSSICALAFCVAGLLVVLIMLAMKFVVFIGKALAKEPCTITIVWEMVFAFLFSFFIVLLSLVCV